MIKLNTTEGKELSFEVQIEGVLNYDKIESYFTVVINEIRYSFPCKISEDSIVVDIPPLSKVIGQRIKEGNEVEVKLEVIADGHYISPWSDTAKLVKPLVVEAKIKGDEILAPKVETKLVSEIKKPIKKVVESKQKKSSKKEINIEEFKKNLKEEDIYKIMEKLGSKNKKIQKIIYEQACTVSKTQQPQDILKSVIKILKRGGK